MALSKLQILLITSSIALFFILWKGCDTKPKNIQALEKSRALTVEATGIENLIADARKSVAQSQIIVVEAMLSELEQVKTDTSATIETLKKISAKWFDLGQSAIAGHYADKIAEIKKDDTSWSLAGTTYLLCMKNTEVKTVKDFCYKRGVSAFENAISLAPSNVDHRIHLALCNVENPPAENPMNGILMLRDLNTKHPENVSVLNQLGRLAIKTNQIPKALERLEKAISIDKNNIQTICLLAEAYSASGDQVKAASYSARCKQK